MAIRQALCSDKNAEGRRWTVKKEVSIASEGDNSAPEGFGRFASFQTAVFHIGEQAVTG